MTVHDLIKLLSTCDPKTEVVIESDADACSAMAVSAIECRTLTDTDDLQRFDVDYTSEKPCVMIMWSAPTEFENDKE